MTAPTYTEVEDRLSKMQDYIDRLYKTITFNGVTCGLLMSNPGLPVWADINNYGLDGVWVGNTDAGDTKGVWLYEDGTWTEKDNGMSTAAKEGVREISVCPHNPDILIASTEDGVWRTTDRGANWSELTMPDACDYGNIAWDTENAGRVLISGSDLDGSYPYGDPRAAKSTNYGASWSSVDLPSTSTMTAQTPGPIFYHNGRAIILHSDCSYYTSGRYWYTSDDGANWDHNRLVFENSGNFRIAGKLAPNDGDGNCLFSMGAASYNTHNQAETTDEGDTFSYNDYAPAGPPNSRFGGQMVYDDFNDRLWSIGSDGALYYSDNWGASWTEKSITGDVTSVAVDQGNGYIYIGVRETGTPSTNQGVFLSVNNGSSFSKLGDREFVGNGIAGSYTGNPAGRFSQKRIAMGQFFGALSGLQPHSMVSGQTNAPAWVLNGTYGGTSDTYVIGLEAGTNRDFKYVPSQAERQYSTVNSETRYKLYYARVETDPGPPPVYDSIEFNIAAGDTVDVYIGPTRVVEKLETKNDQSWESNQVTKQSNALLTSLKYPPRHGFHLGKMFYYARNDTTKGGYFDNSIEQSGFAKDIYEVLYGDWVYAYDPYYIFSRAAYKDTELSWLLGDTMTALPVGLASDGQYVYPQQSKITAAPMGSPVPLWWAFIESTRFNIYNRMLWAMQMLRLGEPWDTWPSPALAGVFGGLSLVRISPIDVADEAIEIWDSNRYDYVHNGILTDGSPTVTGLGDTSMLIPGTAVAGTGVPASTVISSIDTTNSITLSQNATETGSQSLTFKVTLGMPPSSGQYVVADQRLHPSTGKGVSFSTAIFLALMSWLGYGANIPKYQAYADDAARALCNAVWGMSPNNAEKGYIDGTEYTRPNHVGGVLVAWEAPAAAGSTTVQNSDKETFEKYLDDGVVWDFRAPFIGDYDAGIAVVSPAGYFQKLEEPVPSPTNMEGTVVSYIALRVYNAYRLNRAYPAGTWSYGLDMGGAAYGYVGGKVTASGNPVSGATVILCDGTQTANPQDLAAYMTTVQTDSNGAWSTRFETTGNKTIYVVKSGYKHVYKTYNFAQLDQNIAFPDAALVSV